MSAPTAPTRLRVATGMAVRLVLPEIAVGGEGVVYGVVQPRDHVVKLYHAKVIAQKGALLQAKLRAMAHNPPADPTAGEGTVALVWPQSLVLDDRGAFAGFLMPFVDHVTSVEMHMVANPADRRHGPLTPRWVAGFTWEYLLRVAVNLCRVTESLHAAGYVVGDFNERNVLVHSNALVTMVDCDSMQVPRPDGPPFLCEVFRPEFTAPELLHVNLSREVRAPSSDLFPLAIHIYQLLMEGRHPFAGIWHGRGDKPERQELAAKGLFVQIHDTSLGPQAGTPPFEIFPPEVRHLFMRAFVDGARHPQDRPTAAEWRAQLEALGATLVTCGRHRDHRYPSHLGGSCPWCELGKVASVATLPPTNLSDAASVMSSKRRRAAPAQPAHAPVTFVPRRAPLRAPLRLPLRRRRPRATIIAGGVLVSVLALVVIGGVSHRGTPTGALTPDLSGLGVDNHGNMYVSNSEPSVVRRITPAGQSAVIAGNGKRGDSGDGGPATKAEFDLRFQGAQMAVDAAGNLYLPDWANGRVRRVDRAGIITTVAGGARSGLPGDGGPATKAEFENPGAVAVDAKGNLYVTDEGISTNGGRVRKIDPAGTITTIAGGGDGRKAEFGDGSPGTQATLDRPEGLAVDAAANVYVADQGHRRIRKIDTAGIITTVAGTGATGENGDGGRALDATFEQPIAVAVDAAGNLYVVDLIVEGVRRIDAAGTITTVMGLPSTGSFGDPPVGGTRLSFPFGIAIDPVGNLLVMDEAGVKRLDSSGTVTPVPLTVKP